MNANAERTHCLHDLGLAYIRAAIRASLAEVDTEIAVAGILHSASSRRLPPPEIVPISVMPAHAPVVTVDFTGNEIQDSWQGVRSPGVEHKVGAFAAEYRRLRTSNGGYVRIPASGGRAGVDKAQRRLS